MQIDWWTFGLQALNFGVLVWLLWRFLYKPVYRVIDERKKLAQQAFTDADEAKKKTEATRLELEKRLAKLADEQHELVTSTHQQLERERTEIMEAARQEASKIIKAARESVAKERRNALTELRGDVADLAIELSMKLLREAGGEIVADIALDHLVNKINHLSTEELNRLKGDLSAEHAKLIVVTANRLSAEHQPRWRGRLEECFGKIGSIEFAVDEAIGGGAELRLPHNVLGFTWRDQMASARKLLLENENAS